MGKMIRLTASDGHELDAYKALPQGMPKGGIIIIQEAFGLNDHIKGVADSYAAQGYAVVAPALFDRIEPDLYFSYEDVGAAVKALRSVKNSLSLKDVGAALDHLRTYGKVATVGYCWGGRLSYLAASHLPVVAAVSYYGGGIVENLHHIPIIPVLYHFGELDDHIPQSDVMLIKEAYPEATIHIYENAYHGFNCDARISYHGEHAAMAFKRSLDFLDAHM